MRRTLCNAVINPRISASSTVEIYCYAALRKFAQRMEYFLKTDPH